METCFKLVDLFKSLLSDEGSQKLFERDSVFIGRLIHRFSIHPIVNIGSGIESKLLKVDYSIYEEGLDDYVH